MAYIAEIPGMVADETRVQIGLNKVNSLRIVGGWKHRARYNPYR
jgi:hypothetical protein